MAEDVGVRAVRLDGEVEVGERLRQVVALKPEARALEQHLDRRGPQLERVVIARHRLGVVAAQMEEHAEHRQREIGRARRARRRVGAPLREQLLLLLERQRERGVGLSGCSGNEQPLGAVGGALRRQQGDGGCPVVERRLERTGLHVRQRARGKERRARRAGRRRRVLRDRGSGVGHRLPRPVRGRSAEGVDAGR